MPKLKVGDSAEVVEVLTGGGYISIFKVGGWTIGHASDEAKTIIRCLGNVDIPWRLGMRIDSEVRPVGRLTITKLK